MCHLLSASLFLLSGIFQHFLFILDIPQFKTCQSLNLLLFTLVGSQYLWWGLAFFLNAWNVSVIFSSNILYYSLLSLLLEFFLHTCVLKIHSICPLCQLLFEISLCLTGRENSTICFSNLLKSLCFVYSLNHFISIYLLCF